MTQQELLYRMAFASIKGMNCRFGADILSRTDSEEVFFTTSTTALKSLLGLHNNILDKAYRDSLLEAARKELDFVLSHNITPIYFTDGDIFPHRLAECDDAPAMLYSLGQCNLNAQHIVAVVGTRHATVYGLGFTRELIEELSQRLPDTVVVSGLAYGIDVAAHKESLARNVPTVGVLAHGLSTIYPSAHRNVAAEMVKNGGALLTEYVHDAPMHRGNFVARNRIVAGLADCTVVVESAVKGGAMITAEIAFNYNRDVLALPGRNSDTYSRGCNRLIVDHRASLVENFDDLLNIMGWESAPQPERQPELFYQPTPDEQKVLDFLTHHGEGFINRIAVETGIAVHRLMGLLIDMEFKKLIVSLPGGIFRKA